MPAGMVIDLEIWVEDSDTPQHTRADQRDMVVFERHYKMGVERARNDMTVTWLRFIAWAALRRTGKTEIGFDDWDKKIISVEPVDDDPVGPTSPAASTTS